MNDFYKQPKALVWIESILFLLAGFFLAVLIIEKASTFYRANLFINFIDLCWMYSLSRGKVSIPALWDAKKASIQGHVLVAQKEKLEALFGKVSR
jgi:hypothetical protein